MRLIVLFSLKPGVSHDDYKAWALAHDLPTVRALPSISGFDVFQVTSLLGGGTPPYDYVEIIDVDDLDQFGKDVASERMQAIAAEFGALADALFLTTEPL